LGLIVIGSFAGNAGAQTPAPASTSAPSASAAPSAQASPVATPTILMLAPNAPPEILWVAFSSLTPKVGDLVTETVLTSSNVASVEIRTGGYGFAVPKVDVGRFEGAYRVPSLPFFVSKSLLLEVIARNAAGVAAQRSVSMQIR
jgi:hypothetical protein